MQTLLPDSNDKSERKKILIVEDNDDLRRMMQVALEKSGYLVTGTSGAHHALHYAYEEKPDLVLLDIGLANSVNGWEVLKRLKARQETASIPVMMVSAASHEINLRYARSAGADDFLPKPFGIPELLMRVERILLSHSIIEYREMTVYADRLHVGNS